VEDLAEVLSERAEHVDAVARWGRGPASVPVAGGCGGLDLVPVAGYGHGAPAGGFLGVVAGLAEALAVVDGGLAAVDDLAAVSLTISRARNSEISPRPSAAWVCGISCTSARPIP